MDADLAPCSLSVPFRIYRLRDVSWFASLSLHDFWRVAQRSRVDLVPLPSFVICLGSVEAKLGAEQHGEEWDDRRQQHHTIRETNGPQKVALDYLNYKLYLSNWSDFGFQGVYSVQIIVCRVMCGDFSHTLFIKRIVCMYWWCRFLCCCAEVWHFWKQHLHFTFSRKGGTIIDISQMSNSLWGKIIKLLLS